MDSFALSKCIYTTVGLITKNSSVSTINGQVAHISLTAAKHKSTKQVKTQD